MPIFGLGIESSCDETGISLVEDGVNVIANPLFSQIELHKQFKGVVPENASRAHLEKIPYLVREALEKLGDRKLDYIAVTVKPGLVGSLLVGFNTALALSRIYRVPIIPIHHLEAHLYAIQIEDKLTRKPGEVNYPFLGLLLSGGNSALYKIKALGEVQIIGDTLDDACGEALDKAAAKLGLPYPGGPYIEKAAKAAGQQSKKNPLPKILKNQKNDEFNFSFSGLKTSLMYVLQKIEKGHLEKYSVEQLCYFYQERAFELISRNLKNAILHHDIKNVIAAGGVLANSMLTEHLKTAVKEVGAEIQIPPLKLCTDNAAMIASIGCFYFRENRIESIQKVTSDNGFS